MSVQRRAFLTGLSASIALSQAVWPAMARGKVNSLRILCPYQAGGVADILCRLVAKQISSDYADSTIVENKTGAAAQLALTTVKASPADGSTIILAPIAALTLYPFTYKKLPYDPEKDFLPLTAATLFNQALAVGDAVPSSVTTVQQFLAWINEDPKSRGAIGAPGVGDFPHLALEMLKRSKSGAALNVVPYRGAPSALTDMMGGGLSAVLMPIGALLELLADRKLRLLAVTGEKRSPFVPTVATFAEQGFERLSHNAYFAFFARSGTPTSLASMLSAELRSALGDKKVAETLATFGMEPMVTSADGLASLMSKDRAKWEVFVREVGYQPT